MAVNTEKNSYTLIFAIGMVLIVGTVLAGLFGTLNGNIKENEKKEKKLHFLYAEHWSLCNRCIISKLKLC